MEFMSRKPEPFFAPDWVAKIVKRSLVFSIIATIVSFYYVIVKHADPTLPAIVLFGFMAIGIVLPLLVRAATNDYVALWVENNIDSMNEILDQQYGVMLAYDDMYRLGQNIHNDLIINGAGALKDYDGPLPISEFVSKEFRLRNDSHIYHLRIVDGSKVSLVIS